MIAQFFIQQCVEMTRLSLQTYSNGLSRHALCTTLRLRRMHYVADVECPKIVVALGHC